MHVEQHVAYGGQRFWETAPEQFREFHMVGPRLQRVVNDLVMRGYPDCQPVQRIILNLTMLAGVSMAEITTLVQSGLGPGAMKIARSILEYAINAEFLRRFPAELENYRDWHWVEQKQLLDYFRQYSPDSLEEIPAEDRERTELGFAQVRQRFEYQTARGPRLRSSWCAKNLAARAAVTDFTLDYKTIYAAGSRILHGSFGGLGSYFNVDQDQDRIAVPPSLDWCVQALIGGHSCLVRITETLASAVNVEPVPSIADLVHDYHNVWDPKAIVKD